MKKHILATAVLAEAMKNGWGKLFQSNLVLHGPPGAGKSSVKRVILGQPPLPKHKQSATDILERSVRAVSIDRIASTDRHFEVVDNEQIIDRLAGEVKNYLEEKASRPTFHALQVEQDSQSVPHSNDSGSSHDASVISADGNSHSALVGSGKGDSVVDSLGSEDDAPSLTTAESSIREKLLETEPSSRIYDSHWHHYVDSGGQPQFLDVLPLLYRSPSHCIVVIRLSEGLDAKPKVRFYDKGEDVYDLPDHLVLTNREMIVRSCQIARSIARATKGKFTPRVFVIGTHKDKLGLFSRSKHLKNINEEIAPVYQSYDDVLISKSRSSNEFIFPVNAIAKGQKRKKFTAKIQQHIKLATEKAGDPVFVPMKWLIFHLEIDKGDGVVRMTECCELGEKLGMDRDKVHLALEFLNQAALVLYYPADVPDLVLTKMDPFTNRLSQLIKASFIPPDTGLVKESTELRRKGVFKKQFLEGAFKDIEDNLLSDDEFLKLLESLKVAVHIRGDEYFLPSALSLDCPPEESFFESGPTPLALLWDEELILPHGFFLTVAVELLTKLSSADGYKLELRTDIAQWREEIQVSEANREIPGVVKLTDRKKWIQVSYSSDRSFCPLVYQHVDGATQRAVERFQHMGMQPPKVGYICPLCIEKDHYCYVSRNRQFVTCSKISSKTGPVTQDILSWMQGKKTIRVFFFSSCYLLLCL